MCRLKIANDMNDKLTVPCPEGLWVPTLEPSLRNGPSGKNLVARPSPMRPGLAQSIADAWVFTPVDSLPVEGLGSRKGWGPWYSNRLLKLAFGSWNVWEIKRYRYLVGFTLTQITHALESCFLRRVGPPGAGFAPGGRWRVRLTDCSSALCRYT